MSKPHTIEFVKNIAKNKGGECLSFLYKNQYQKLDFLCKNKHKFETCLNNILHQNSWCPQCQSGLNEELCRNIFEQLYGQEFKKTYFYYNKHHLELDGFNSCLNVAFEYNGKQHYELTPYYPTKKDLEYRKYLDLLKLKYCNENNITLIVIPYTIKTNLLNNYIQNELKIYNNKIDIISFIDKFDKFKKTKKEIDKIIKEKEGVLLNLEFEKVKIRCKKNHEWTTTTYVLKQGHWCKKCHNIRDFENIIKKIKDEKITCLSKKEEYIDGNSILRFKCDNGHEFKDSVNRIIGRINEKKRVNIRKTCQFCLNESQKNALNKIKKNGLEPLNINEYTSKKEEIMWVCINGQLQKNKLKNLMEKLRRNGKICKCEKCLN